MKNVEIRLVASESEFEDLDELFWKVLWEPLGLPRDIRKTFVVEGEGVDLIAVNGSSVIGGISANWIFPFEVDLRHLAVIPEFQRNNIGSLMVKKLISIVSQRNCVIIRTIARNTSSEFFKMLGFVPSADGNVPEHPAFKKHGISFEMLEISRAKF